MIKFNKRIFKWLNTVDQEFWYHEDQKDFTNEFASTFWLIKIIDNEETNKKNERQK